MFLPLVAIGSAFLRLQDDTPLHKSLILLDSHSGKQTGYVEQRSDPLTHPQFSPKMFPGGRWQFEWQTITFEKLTSASVNLARFSVFSQVRKPDHDPAFSVARMLERLWEYNYTQLKRDHSQLFGDGVIDVYLCKGGEPGGEQRFDEDRVNGRSRKVNTIYLYDLDTFTEPIEMAREVAHEYGHASLPGVNGYSAPEDWANGFLGEKLYLKHLDEAIKRGDLTSADAMDAPAAALDTWVRKNVDPLIELGAESGPDLALLKERSKQGMDHFIGLALYASSILPEKCFSRSLDLIPSSNAEDYVEAAVTAAEEPSASYSVQFPGGLVGKTLWVPLGSSTLKGAPILARKLGWVRIKAPAAGVEIKPAAH